MVAPVYLWEGPGGFSSVASSPRVSQAGTYAVTLTDLQGCMLSDSISVMGEEDFPVNRLTTLAYGCDPSTLILDFMLEDDLPLDSVRWTGPGGFSSAEDRPDFTEPGTYELTLHATNGCTSSSQVEVMIDVTDPLIIDITPQECGDGTITACWVPLPALSEGISYAWLDETGTQVSTDSCFTTTLAGDYTLVATLDNGCRGEMSMALAPVDATLIAATTMLGCDVDSIVLSKVLADPGADNNYQWTLNGDPLAETSAVLTVTEPGLYVLTATSAASGCTAMDSLLISMQTTDLNGQDLTITQGDCEEGAQITLADIATLSAVVLDGEMFLPSERYLLEAGPHMLTLVDNAGCTLDTSFIIDPIPAISVDIGPDLSDQMGTMLTLGAQTVAEVVSYVWEGEGLSCTDCGMPQLTLDADQVIVLTIVDAEGCVATDTLQVVVLRDEEGEQEVDSPYYFPSHFMPGLEGQEAFVLGLDAAAVLSYEVRIYDRWGSLVAEVSGMADSPTVSLWDGRVDNGPAEQGVYVYMAEFLYSNRGPEIAAGTITLIR